MNDKAAPENKRSEKFETVKALFWLAVMELTGLGLFILAGVSVYTGRIKSKGGADLYNYYSEEPVSFTIQVALMVIFGCAAFFGPLYLIFRKGRK